MQNTKGGQIFLGDLRGTKCNMDEAVEGCGLGDLADDHVPVIDIMLARAARHLRPNALSEAVVCLLGSNNSLPPDARLPGVLRSGFAGSA